MSRERLMAEQRRRMEERRKRLKNVKEAAAKKTTKKAVTRDPSKDQSRKEIARLTGGKKPKTGDAVKQKLTSFASKKPALKQPATPVKSPATPVKSPTSKGKDRFFKGSVTETQADNEIKNKTKAKANFFKGSVTETQATKEIKKPQMKKPKRSSFPAGRGGASKYAAALRAYNASTKKPTVKKKKYDRRGRAI
jgi:hypothetical protein